MSRTWIRHVLARQRCGQSLSRSARGRIRRARMELGRKFANAMRQHVLLHVALRAKAFVAQYTLERPLLRVTSVVYFERAIASKRLKA